MGFPGWCLAAGKPCCAVFNDVCAASDSQALPIAICCNTMFPVGPYSPSADPVSRVTVCDGGSRKQIKHLFAMDLAAACVPLIDCAAGLRVNPGGVQWEKSLAAMLACLPTCMRAQRQDRWSVGKYPMA